MVFKIKQKIQLMIVILIVLSFYYSFAQDNREQKAGKPKSTQKSTFQLKGKVINSETGQSVPNADITVKETSKQKIINQSKSNDAGKYELNLPKGVELEVKAQAPEFFFDAFKVNVGLGEQTEVVEHSFSLPSELRLRINFPSNKYNDPYPFVLDDNGNETNQTWQDALTSVAEDIIKYSETLEKVILVGHTDDVGKEDFNIKLGQNRVEFVKSELGKRGVNEMIVEVSSAGKSQLIEQLPNEDKELWRKRCRRVVMNKVMKK